MEKKNKTKSAFKNTTDIFRRNTKSRLAIQKFLNNLQEQESEYLNENKQITQCVFLGALCLKPVPDIFQVTLQPISFTTQSKTTILYNNIGKTVNNNVTKGDGTVESEDISKVNVRKNRKNTKTSTIKTNVFIGNVCEPKPRNRIFELFNNRNLSTNDKVHAKSSKVTLKLNGKSKKNRKINYKIKVGGILNRSKKDPIKQKEKKVPMLTEAQKIQCSLSLKTVEPKTSKTKVPKSKSYLQNINPVTKVNEKCEMQSKNSNKGVNDTKSPLKIKISKKCKRDSEIKNSAVDNAIERLRKNRGIEVKKVTKMENKLKKIPSLVPVKSLTSENSACWEFKKKSEIDPITSVIIDPCFKSSNAKQGASYLKEGHIDLMEIDDEIEDYLEIDQNIVADLEALIPEEEIESISNTLINSTIQMPAAVFKSECINSEISPVDSVNVNQSLDDINCDLKKIENVIIGNTGKSKEIIKIDDINEDVEIEKIVKSENKAEENSKPNDVSETVAIIEENFETKLENCISENSDIVHDLEQSDQQTNVSERRSDEDLSISKKFKVSEKSEEIKRTQRENQVQKSYQKVETQLNKHTKVKQKTEILKKVRKITDFLFPIGKTDKSDLGHSTIDTKTASAYRGTVKEYTKSMKVLMLEKPSDSVSFNVKKESVVETRTLRSCSKQSTPKYEDTKMKKTELPKLIPAKNSVRNRREATAKEHSFESVNSMETSCENEKAIHSKEMIVLRSNVRNSCENNSQQRNENIMQMDSGPILPVVRGTDCSISTPPTENDKFSAYRSPRKGIVLDKFVDSECEIIDPVVNSKDTRSQSANCIETSGLSMQTIQEKKKSSEIKKIIKPKLEKNKSREKTDQSCNLQLEEEQIDVKQGNDDELVPQHIERIMEKQSNSNEQNGNHDKITKLSVAKTRLRSEVDADWNEQYNIKLQADNNQSNTKIVEKYIDTKKEYNMKKRPKLNVTKIKLRSGTVAEEIRNESEIESIDKTDPNANINETISKISLRSVSSSRNQKMIPLTNMKEDTKLKITETSMENTVGIENKVLAPMLEHRKSERKSKRIILDSDLPNASSLPSNKVPDKNTLKMKEKWKVTNVSPPLNVQTVTESQMDQQNEQLGSICLNSIIESAIENEENSSHTASKTRLQLKNRNGEIPIENSKPKKVIHSGKNSELVIGEHNECFDDLQIQSEKLTLSKSQDTCIFPTETGNVDEKCPAESSSKEKPLKNNFSRVTRKNKLENERLSIITDIKIESTSNSETKSKKKRSSMNNEQEKRATKKSSDQKTRKHMEMPNENTVDVNLASPTEKKSEVLSSSKKKNRYQLKAENLKVLSKRNHLKAKRVLKRLTHLKGESKKNMQIKKSETNDKKQIFKSMKRVGKLEKQSGEISQTGNNPEEHEKIILKSESSDILTSEIEVISIEQNNSIVGESKSNGNKTSMSNNRKRNKVIKSPTPKIQNSAVGETNIISKIEEGIDTKLKQKIVLEKGCSSNTLVEMASKIKPRNKQLNKMEIDVNNTIEIFSGENQLKQQKEKNNSQNVVDEMKKQICVSTSSGTSEKKDVNIASSQDLSSLKQKNLFSEIESNSVQTGSSNDRRRKKAQNTSSIFKVENDDCPLLKQTNILEVSSKEANTALIVVSKTKLKTKHQLKKEETAPTESDQKLITGDQLKEREKKKINSGFSKKSPTSEEVNEEIYVFDNIAVDAASTQIAPISQQKNHTSEIERGKLGTDFPKSGKRNKEQNKLQNNMDDQLQLKNAPGDTVIGHSKEDIVDVKSETKSKKKPSSKGKETKPIKADAAINIDKFKSEVPETSNEEKHEIFDDEIDMMPSHVVATSQQQMLTVSGNSKIEIDNSRKQNKNEAQNKSPSTKTQNDLDDLLHPKNVSERTGIWSTQQKLNKYFVKQNEKVLQKSTNDKKAATSDKKSSENHLVQRSGTYDSLDLVLKTEDQEIKEDEKEISNEASCDQAIERQNKKELIEDLVNSGGTTEFLSSSAKKTPEASQMEPKKRRRGRTEPQDRTVNIKAPRKRKNKAIVDSDGIENDVRSSKPPKSEKTDAEDNYNIPYLLKKDLSNPNSELSQEIERQMRLEFSREFPNYGASAPEPYRRIYRCRICLLVCETYGRLKLHRRIHDVATPYQCQQCDKSYDDVEDLAAHLRIHRDRKPEKTATTSKEA